jgi:dTDP-glucose 4,6-dehydratase
MKRILITGIGGFIGSHFLSHFLLNTDWQIIGTDSWRHKGISERITHNKHYQDNKSRVTILTHDLTTPFSNIAKKTICNIDYIVNLASESHVERSITDPVDFVKNNVAVVLNVLELAREIKPEKFIQIGTDESYGATDEYTAHKEWDTILPSNPYSASKASQEAIAISYWRTYGVPVILTNTMNNFAEMQDPEKFLPMTIKKILSGEVLEIHANPELTKSGSRYWIHARNHADAILFLLNNCQPKMYPEFNKPERFNIVGERRINNLELAQKISEILDKPLKYKLVDAHTSRSGHDLHYGLNGEKLRELGWIHPIGFDLSLNRTVSWYLDNKEWLGL